MKKVKMLLIVVTTLVFLVMLFACAGPKGYKGQGSPHNLTTLNQGVGQSEGPCSNQKIDEILNLLKEHPANARPSEPIEQNIPTEPESGAFSKRLGEKDITDSESIAPAPTTVTDLETIKEEVAKNKKDIQRLDGNQRQIRDAISALAERILTIPEGNEFAVIIKSFNEGSSTLTPGMITTLDGIAVQVENEEIEIEKIEGYADVKGSPARNRIISEKRAQAGKDYLISKNAVTANIPVFGKGVTKKHGICKDNRSLVIFATKI